MTLSLSGGTPLRWPWEVALTSALPTSFRYAQSSSIISPSSSITSRLWEWFLTGVLSVIFAPAPGLLFTFKHRYGTGSGSDLVLAFTRSLPLPVPYRCLSIDVMDQVESDDVLDRKGLAGIVSRPLKYVEELIGPGAVLFPGDSGPVP